MMDDELAKLKKELTEWFDQRIDEAVDRGNADLMKDIEPQFNSVLTSVSVVSQQMTSLFASESKDIASVSDSLAGLLNAALAPITVAIQKITSFIPI
jgi:hypothetical protein